jgi:hypothetical protein
VTPSRSAPLDSANQPGSGFRVISGRYSRVAHPVTVAHDDGTVDIWQIFFKAPSQFAQSARPDPRPIPGPVPC